MDSLFVDSGEYARLETLVTGPATISFWQKYSSTEEGDATLSRCATRLEVPAGQRQRSPHEGREAGEVKGVVRPQSVLSRCRRGVADEAVGDRMNVEQVP